MNAAVTLLAEAANRNGAGGGRAHGRADQDPRRPPDQRRRDQGDGGALRALRHRRHDQRDPAPDMKPEDVTEEQAIALIDERAAKGPAKKKGGRKKAPAKKKAAPKKGGRISHGRERFERHRQPWTSEEVGKLKTLACKGKGLKEIAKALNRTEESTRDKAKELGIAIAKQR